jgi:hypothetical protein
MSAESSARQDELSIEYESTKGRHASFSPHIQTPSPYRGHAHEARQKAHVWGGTQRALVSTAPLPETDTMARVTRKTRLASAKPSSAGSIVKPSWRNVIRATISYPQIFTWLLQPPLRPSGHRLGQNYDDSQKQSIPQ